jgi:hypothetical protein
VSAFGAALGARDVPALTPILDGAARLHTGFADELDALGRALVDELAARDALHPSAGPPSLALPATLSEMVAIAIALDENDGRAAIGVRQHYLALTPRLCLEQRLTRDEPAARFFHTPLDWEALPRLRGAIERLFADVAAAAPRSTRPTIAGFDSAAALVAGCPTLATLYQRTYYGRAMPLLHGWSHDLAYYARALDGGARLEAVIDRHLAAPLIHELTHFDEARPALFPLYLDECVAGYLGIRQLPSFAYPPPGEDVGIFSAPWFAQVGQALCRAIGVEAVVRAQAGLVAWEQAMPPGLWRALVRVGWRDWLDGRYLHFLANPLAPDPWLKLIFLGAGNALDENDPRQASLAALAALPWSEVPVGDEVAFDRTIVEDGLRAMCLESRLDAAHYVVGRRPPPAPIAIDLDACRVSTSARPPSPPGELAVVEAGPPAYLFPPAVAARLRASGLVALTVEIADPTDDAIADLAAAVLAGRPATGAAGRVHVR